MTFEELIQTWFNPAKRATLGDLFPEAELAQSEVRAQNGRVQPVDPSVDTFNDRFGNWTVEDLLRAQEPRRVRNFLPQIGPMWGESWKQRI